MSTGSKFKKSAGMFLRSGLVLCCALLCLGSLVSANTQRKSKKVPLPPLPSGPTGPVPQIPLDSMKPVPPQVSFQDGQLTIVAPNSTLGDILRAVRKQTGAEIEVPEASERVVTHLGPGPAREVIADLLNGSRFNYVLLGSADNGSQLTRVVLVMKTGPENAGMNNSAAIQAQPATMQANASVTPPEQADAGEADAVEDAADDTSTDQSAEADQPAAAPADPNAIKTPQQMLQEMQQRQMQMQQNQPQGRTPLPGVNPPPAQPQQEP
jgi:hypothetical protein